MSEITIELTRDDLIERKKDIPLTSIKWSDFSSKSVTKQQIEEATLIIFHDEDESIVLKDRYAIWDNEKASQIFLKTKPYLTEGNRITNTKPKPRTPKPRIKPMGTKPRKR